MQKISILEAKRQKLQRQIDREKTHQERNAKGQFSTPINLAKEIIQHAATLLPKHSKIRFFDPGFGTGSFFSAFLETFAQDRIKSAIGYEIDPLYGMPAKRLWDKTVLDLHIADFTKADWPESDSNKYNLIICNPPYIRHHHIIKEDKTRLRKISNLACGVSLSGLSGLYCYFLTISHLWLKNNGIAGWLIPSEFMDVNYGKAVKEYLLNEVTLLQIHRSDPNDVQFDDALVSTAIVWFKKKSVPKNHKVKFTYGGALNNPRHEKDIPTDVLAKESKWTRFPLASARTESEHPKLSDFFSVKRGIATGNNKFFILSLQEIRQKSLPISQFRPVLPSPRYLLDTTEINSDANGYPLINKKQFVLDCKLPIDAVKKQYPELWQYMQEGVQKGVPDRYICRHRKIWYSQENRTASPFYCTYIGRTDKKGKKPFRFFLNRSKAIVANTYLMLYPKPQVERAIRKSPELAKKIVMALNNTTAAAMIDESRVYGGGLHKLEPRELGNINAKPLSELLSHIKIKTKLVQASLFCDSTL